MTIARRRKGAGPAQECDQAAATKPSIDAMAIIRAIDLGRLRSPGEVTGSDILDALDANGWHAGRTARALRIGRATLWRRLTRWGLSLRKEKKKRWALFALKQALKRWEESR